MNSEFRRHIGSTLAVAALATGLAIAGTAAPSFAQDKTVMVGGAAMYPSKNIVENAVHSKDHTTVREIEAMYWEHLADYQMALAELEALVGAPLNTNASAADHQHQHNI